MNKILLLFESYPELMSFEAALKKVGFNVIGLSSEQSLIEQMFAFYPDVIVCSGQGGRINPLVVGARLKEMAWWQGKSFLMFPENFKPSGNDLLKIRVDMVLDSALDPESLVRILAKMYGYNQSELLMRHKSTGASTHLNSETPVKVPSFDSKFQAKIENEAIFVTGKLHGNSAAKFDLKSLENSHLQKKPETSQKAAEGLQEVHSNIQDKEPIIVKQAAHRQELQRAQQKLSAKMKKYSEIVSDVQLAPKSTMGLVDVRRRQREIAAEWDLEKLSDLDQLRREFAAALLKK